MSETVLTSRRARVLVRRRWVPGRLRLTDRAVMFRSLDDGLRIVVPLAAIAGVRTGRTGLVVESAEGTLRLRCFGVAGLLRSVRR